MTLTFKPDNHQYTSDDGTRWTSVTTIVSAYKEPFDSQSIAEKSSKNKKSKWYGIDPKEIQAIWKAEADRSITLGTYYHNQREKDLLNCDTLTRYGCELSIIPSIEDDNGCKIAPEQKLTNGIYPEHFVYLTSAGWCGQADLVEVVNGVVNVSDYKTSKKIDRESYKNWEGISKKMLSPLQHLDDCVAGNTKLITKTGICTIQEVVGKEIEIWNGKQWSKVNPFITGYNRDLYRVFLDDGSFLDVTSNHKFLIKHRLDKGFEEKTTNEIITILNTTKWLPRIPNSNIEYDNAEGINKIDAYDLGFILGDGTVSNKRYVKSELGVNDKNLIFTTESSRFINGRGNPVVTFKVNGEFCHKLKYENALPREIFSWNKKSILCFLSGWLDADGCNRKSGVALYGREDKLRDAQLLLTKCNIKSYLHLASKKGTITNLGERKNDLWVLNITKTIDFYCQRLTCTNSRESSCKGKWQIIQKIEKLEGLYTTYCLTEPISNTCVFNNALTKQCHFNHYALQLSIYMYMILRHNPNLKLGKLVIHHAKFEEAEEKDQYGFPIILLTNGEPIVKEIEYIELPYLKQEVQTLLKQKVW